MYDVIVVGARCAGSPTAMLLARQGHRVLLLDRATFPSDHPLSTHLVHPPTIMRLARWGLLDELRATGCPPIHEYGLACGPVDLMAPLPPAGDIDVAYAPRRRLLDDILVRAAVAAGAELREGVSVQELLTDVSGAVVGVRGKTKDGTTVEERARVVVGADGTRSRVAQLVGAQEYHTRPPLLTSYWSYFAGLAVKDVPTFRANQKYGFAWPTNDNLVLVGMAWRSQDFKRLSGGADDVFLPAFDEIAPDFAERLRDAERAERWMSGSVPNFFRTSHGPGWALVGDAGYSRDPCTASGITEATRAADFLAEALHAGLSGARPMAEALADYQRRRDAHSRPFYEYTCDFATLDDYAPDVLQLLDAATRSDWHAAGLSGLFAQTMTPQEFFSIDSMTRLLTGPQGRELSHWRLRALRTLVAGRTGRTRWARGLGQRLVHGRLGPLGGYLSGEPSPHPS
ncbi:NAD(P)/FAD-dependent oxidoreductase [Streptomyces profundus]|uniref:NAD(P)/FAD-dependent oxidoreductase n=1 Tax=Streptomyces profundus TaxID=2867410 RepID=UPI001D168DD5|nr:NAD(P)/FAD-dependent oxidoreductase [Streptomyces sp. MA3_2.13]UED86503.1 NAD(P)/FAD-dependent oxidoreductase [Streptomyces sp. MA3_2.13]